MKLTFLLAIKTDRTKRSDNPKENSALRYDIRPNFMGGGGREAISPIETYRDAWHQPNITMVVGLERE
jgi:hypothetical protein